MQNPIQQNEYIPLGSNGNTIYAKVYEPTIPSHISLILSSATGAKQGYFRHFAHFMQTNGIRVVTYDYSGIGRSAPKNLKGFQTTMKDWGVHDLTTVIDYVSAHFEYEKLILVGQSVGGQIPPFSPSIHKVDGLVNVASQSGYWKMWHFPLNLLLRLNWFGMLVLTKLFGYFPGKTLGAVGDLPKGVALDWAKWGTTPEYFMSYLENAKHKFTSLKIPLLAYSFSDDRTAPKQCVEWLNRQYANCRLTHRHIQPKEIGVKQIGHFGFFRPKCKILWKEVLEEILSW